MKILFYNHTGQVSGAERMLLMILARLDRGTFESLVICPEQGSLAEMVNELGVRVERIEGLNARFTWQFRQLARYLRSFFRVIRQLRQKVVSNNPDLLHANSIRAGLVATTATVGLGTRVVWHLHDMLPRHPLSPAIRLFAGLSTRTHMIAVSEAVARNFRGGLGRLLENRLRVILNAIDLNNFQMDSAARLRVRKELRFRADDLAIGIVGQLTPRKGQLELLRAFNHALTKVPNMVLVVVGAPLFNSDHEYLKLIKSTATELGIANKVRLPGARNDIATIMQGLDVLVVNSKVEPFGLVVLEAMACGAPVLAAGVDGIPEIIRHNENGWLFSPQDEAALAQAIEYLSLNGDLRKRLAEQGRTDVRAHFAVERYLGELQSFYCFRTKSNVREFPLEATSKHAEAAKFA